MVWPIIGTNPLFFFILNRKILLIILIVMLVLQFGGINDVFGGTVHTPEEDEIMLREMLTDDGHSPGDINRMMIETFPEHFPGLQANFSFDYSIYKIMKELKSLFSYNCASVFLFMNDITTMITGHIQDIDEDIYINCYK